MQQCLSGMTANHSTSQVPLILVNNQEQCSRSLSGIPAKHWRVPCQQNTGDQSVKWKQTGCWSEIWQHTQPLHNRWATDQLYMIVNNCLLLRNVTAKHFRPEPAGNDELAADLSLFQPFHIQKQWVCCFSVQFGSTLQAGTEFIEVLEKTGLSRASIVTFKDLRN